MSERKPWQFKPGNKAGGRTPGSRNKLNEKFLRDFLGAWEAHGAEALTRVAADDPSTFVRVAASILPKHVEHKHSIIDELQKMPLDEMKRRLAELRARSSDDDSEADRDRAH